MAVITGKDGALSLGNDGTIHFRSWAINDYGHQSINGTKFTDACEVNVAGIKRWSFTAEGILDGSASASITSSASTVTFTAAASRTYIGQCIFRISPSVDVQGEATISVSGDCAGDLAIA